MGLTWSEGLNTGSRVIDLQHQELIEIINELESVYQSGKAETSLDSMIQRLSSYAVFHFQTEEALIYASTNAVHHTHQHVQEHNEFAAWITSLKALPEQERRRTLGASLDYLKSWLLKHVMVMDKELVRLAHGKPNGDAARSPF